MPRKKPLSKDKQLHDFLKVGGRTGTEVDFNAILKRAVPRVKPTKPNTKKSK